MRSRAGMVGGRGQVSGFTRILSQEEDFLRRVTLEYWLSDQEREALWARLDSGATKQDCLSELERRLDVILWRKLTTHRLWDARSMIWAGLCALDGALCTRPETTVRPGQEIRYRYLFWEFSILVS